MLAKLIPTRIHGVLDYLTGLALIAIPLLFNWPQPEAMIFMVLGAAALVYSLITRYELGVFKLLPMPAHLVLDLLSGLALVGAPFLGFVDDNLRPWFWAFGLFEIVVALITSTRPHFAEDDYAAQYSSGVAMTGRNTTIAEGDRDTRYGVTNSTYTGSTHERPLPTSRRCPTTPGGRRPTGPRPWARQEKLKRRVKTSSVLNAAARL